MKKVKKIIKNNVKVLIAFILGGIILGTGGVYAATVINASDVSYKNASSGMTSTNVQGAIEELNTKIQADKIKAYEFSYGGCHTGEESNCMETTCYQNKAVGSCAGISYQQYTTPTGTIIKYKVNNNETKSFYVLHDDGDTITMLAINPIKITTTGYTSSDWPSAIITELNEVVSNWTNVNIQNYTYGITNFNNTNAYTECSSETSCTSNSYTYSASGRARLATVQEVNNVGAISPFYKSVLSQYPQSPTMLLANTKSSAVWGVLSTGSVSTILTGSTVPKAIMPVVVITKP